jgi:cytoskeletal protein RodZ
MAMTEGEEEVELTVGERLRAAREAANMSIEDLATSTRIPTRHLESLENSDFARLPAPTYSIGFAKSYAGAVGLNRDEIGDQLRAELGGTRLNAHQAEQFEPVDPARAMPRRLNFAANAAIIVGVLAANWIKRGAENAPDEVAVEAAAPPSAVAPPAAPAPAAQGPVIITANQAAWIQVKDGATLLKEGILEAGQSFEVPPTAAAPVLTTGKAEALKISVGTAVAPPIGPPATKVRNVSLLAADLMRGPAQPATVAAAPASTARPAATTAPARSAPRPTTKRAAPPPSVPAPATNTAEPAAPTNTQ